MPALPFLLRLLACALLASTVALPRVQAQQPPSNPALQSTESFLTALNNAKWECSFNIYQRLRFFADKIDLLATDDKVTSTLKRVSHPEPGVVRVDFTSGAVVLFLFSDDLKTFVIAP